MSPNFFAERDQRRRDKAQENELRELLLERERADLRAVCATPEGRRFVGRLLHAGGLFRQSFDGGSGTFFNEGRRSFAVEIFSDLEALDPTGELFIAIQRTTQDAARLESERARVVAKRENQK